MMVMDRIWKRAKLRGISIYYDVYFLGFEMLELYMSNRKEFWFSYRHMLPVIILISILVMTVCLAILSVLPDKLFK